MVVQHIEPDSKIIPLGENDTHLVELAEEYMHLDHSSTKLWSDVNSMSDADRNKSHEIHKRMLEIQREAKPIIPDSEFGTLAYLAMSKSEYETFFKDDEEGVSENMHSFAAEFAKRIMRGNHPKPVVSVGKSVCLLEGPDYQRQHYIISTASDQEAGVGIVLEGDTPIETVISTAIEMEHNHHKEKSEARV